jgi:hypothetical protein
VPPEFASAVRSLDAAQVRAEMQVELLRPPQRLAPWTHALGLRVVIGDDEVAVGRLVLLHDPDGPEGWGGTLRLVGYASVELDDDMLQDPLLPEVGWSWLQDALAEQGAGYAAAAGTITQTASTRFGDIAGTRSAGELEVRASWTPLTPELGPHLQAWAQLLATAAGLPPPGVAVLPARAEPSS